MPIPLILGAAAVAAGLFGLKEHYDASENNSMAESLISNAQYDYDNAKNSLEVQRDSTSSQLDTLGETKIKAWSENIGNFLEVFNKFKNVTIKGEAHIDSNLLKDADFTGTANLKDMQVAAMKATEILTAGAGSIGAGALAGVAAYGGTMMLATATTGTAISALSGVAATNATLAWLGGGSLAAGGLGVAGGTCVLGGIVAGPILALSGLISASKAEENLAQAEETAAKARDAIEKMETMRSFLGSVSEIGENYNSFITNFSRQCDIALDDLRKVYDEAYEVQSKSLINRIKNFFGLKVKINFNNLTEDEQHIMHENYLMIQILYKTLIAPILTKDGDLDNNASNILKAAQTTSMKLLEASK